MAYNGNQNLVGIRDTLEFSKEQVIEYAKCARDPLYFIETYVQIVNVDKGLVPFDMWNFQRDIVELVESERYVICKMPRQIGKTTTIASILLHYVLFNENYSIAILANKLSQAREILGRIQLAFEHLPKWLQQGVVEWNKGYIELANGSKILASATSSSAIRGTSQNCIAGNSIITLKVDGHIFDLPISSLDTNSSKYNYKDTEIGYNVPQQQIYEMVRQYCIDSDPGRYSGSTSHNSKKYGWDRRPKQSRQTINTRTFVGSSSTNKNDDWTKFESDEILLCENVAWEARTNGTDGSRRKETVLDWLEAYRSNQAENWKSQYRTHYVCGNKAQAVVSQEGQISSPHIRMERSYIIGPRREEENKRAFRQNKQESREDQENCRKASWNEKIVGIETKDECRGQRSSALEQGLKKIEVLTTEGFKQFTGLRVIPNKPTINVALLNGYNITCTSDHKIQTTIGWVCAGNLGVDHTVITNNKPSAVVSVVESGNNTVYDILNVEDTHSFLANGISVSNCIYLDEFAFVPNNMQEDFFQSVYPTISSGKTTKVIITSTPNGLNMFHKLWKDSEEERNDYKRVDVHWSAVPGRDTAWKAEVIRNTSEEQFRQEYECEFLGSSNTLISPTKLRMLTYSTPLKTSDDIKVYLEPAQGRLYTLIADTSRALGLDYSAFVIIDITEFPYQVAAVYRNNTISSLLYPSIIYQFAKHYNMAYCLIESNDIGKQVADILYYEHEYENIFYTSSDQRSGQRITGGFSGSAQLGVKTSTTVKRVGCSNFKSMVENDKIILNDFDLIQELYRFSAKGNSYEAEEGHDDLVMTCVLFSWMIEQPFVKELTSTDLRQRIYNDQENVIEEALTPFGIVDDGQDVFEDQPVIAVHKNNDNWLLN